MTRWSTLSTRLRFESLSPATSFCPNSGSVLIPKEVPIVPNLASPIEKIYSWYGSSYPSWHNSLQSSVISLIATKYHEPFGFKLRVFFGGGGGSDLVSFTFLSNAFDPYSAVLKNSLEIFWGELIFEPRTAQWEASMLPLCYAANASWGAWKLSRLISVSSSQRLPSSFKEF